jgi:hypothetical protein
MNTDTYLAIGIAERLCGCIACFDILFVIVTGGPVCQFHNIERLKVAGLSGVTGVTSIAFRGLPSILVAIRSGLPEALRLLPVFIASGVGLALCARGSKEIIRL